MTWLIPNKTRALKTATPAPAYYRYIDTPGISYGRWRDMAGERIGTFEQTPTASVAIIGAGLAGLSAAYELLKCGVNVTLFEAGQRIGGRLYSKKFSEGQPEIAELGAMRFPPSEELLFQYLDAFNIQTTPDFPDPLTVETLIGYKNNTYTIAAGGKVPPEFNTVNQGWNALMADGATLKFVDHTGTTQTVQLAAPNDIGLALQLDANGHPLKPDLDPIAEWQKYLDVFTNKSLFDGLVLLFDGPNPPGDEAWQYPEDYERFASLGTGFGGFGPLYQVGFLEILRLVINSLETDQRFVPSGIESLAESLYSTTLTQPDGTTTRVQDHTQTGVAVTGVYKVGNKIEIYAGGSPVTEGPFDRVIVATTQRAMEIDAKLGMFLPLDDKQPTQPTEVAQSLRDLHIMNSSKVFLRTATQFWNDGQVRCILSDSLSANLYTLDYGGSYGVVLVSYVWGDASIKQISFQDPETRLKLLQEAIAEYDADFAAELVPLDGDYQTNVIFIDWEIQPHFYGAFKLNRPGQEHDAKSLFFEYQNLAGSNDASVFLAGDSVSWVGGWTEGALHTAMNAACGVIQSLGGTLNAADYNPLSSIDADTYNYDVLNG